MTTKFTRTELAASLRRSNDLMDAPSFQVWLDSCMAEQDLSDAEIRDYPGWEADEAYERERVALLRIEE